MESIINVCTSESEQDGRSKKPYLQSQDKGEKWDKGKFEWYNMPLELLKPLSEVFNAGVRKGYGAFNCLNPFDDSDRRFYNSLMRHLEACQIDPLAIDEETGCYHQAQVAFSALMRLRNALMKEKKQ